LPIHSVVACAVVLQPAGNARLSDSEVTVAAPNMPSDPGSSYAWVWVDSSYMRSLAQRCARAARNCPHLPTSHELEAIGVELMEKAAELDELNQTSGTHAASRKTAHRPKVPKK
jgi:hypothetical protein